MLGKIRVQEIVKCFLASLLIGFGISLFVASELGADPTTVFLDGMNRRFGIPVSVTNQVIVAVVLILALLLNRKAVGLNTVIFVLCIGVCVALPEQLIAKWQLSSRGLPIRCVAIFVAQLVMSFGYGWMQTFAAGMSGVDAFLYGIVNRLKIPYAVIRTMFDVGFLVSGWLLGGIVGIGTIFSVAAMGTLTSAMKSAILRFQTQVIKSNAHQNN